VVVQKYEKRKHEMAIAIFVVSSFRDFVMKKISNIDHLSGRSFFCEG